MIEAQRAAAKWTHPLPLLAHGPPRRNSCSGDLSARPTLAEKVAFLSGAASYGEGSRVVAIETHFAWVFLTARHAYKLKKPLRQMHMDYRTLASRKRGCRDELRLNRRLAHAVYLAVVPLSSDRHGVLRIGRGARIEDWLVKMRRLPSSGMLDRTLARRALRENELAALVATLTRFFRKAPRTPLRGALYLARLRREVRANQRSLSSLSSRSQNLSECVASRQLEFITLARDALTQRAAHIVEGHGDLRPEHVFLGPPPCIIDCLEFDRRLRLLDPLEELAFLALEIERLGHRACAAQLTQRFQSDSGEQAREAVTHFYMSHRASTRAKLSAWHIGDPQFPDPRPWNARAHSYLNDALHHVERALRLERDTASRSIRSGRPVLEEGRQGKPTQHPRHRLTQ